MVIIAFIIGGLNFMLLPIALGVACSSLEKNAEDGFKFFIYYLLFLIIIDILADFLM